MWGVAEASRGHLGDDGPGAIVPSSVLGRGAQAPPSERINVASIGVGDMGMGDLNDVMRLDDAQIVAVCDVAEVVDYSNVEFGGTPGEGPASPPLHLGVVRNAERIFSLLDGPEARKTANRLKDTWPLIG